MPSISARSTTRRLRVALVDDHQLVLDGLVARLQSSTVELEVAISATSWSALVASPEFPVDVVVLDLYLDDLIPIDTKLRALTTAGVGAVVMSRHADPAAVSAALRAGARGFVPKTASADELIDAIRTVAGDEEYLTDELAVTVADYTPAGDPGLGRQERRALQLYALGLGIAEVAAQMSTTEETVKSYIKRGRRKYRQIGIDIGTRILLRRHAIREGWLAPDQQ